MDIIWVISKGDINLEKEQIYIAGDSLIIKSVTKNDLEDYLYIKRYATFMKEAYDEKKELWEYMKPRLIENLEGNDCFCLIYYKGINYSKIKIYYE